MQPKQLDFYTAKVEEIYNHLNIRILEVVTQRLAKGDRETVTIPEWQIKKLAETGQLTKETLAVIAEVAGKAPKEIEDAIRQAGYATQKEVDDLMKGHRIVPEMNPMQMLLTQYINRAKYNLDNLINETLMSRQGFGTVTQMYRDIINQTTAEAMTGVATLDQALQRTLNQWAEKGVPSGFVDKAGRRWNIQTYAKAAIKSTTNDVRNEVRRQRLNEYGIHTVIVTSHPSARPACSRIQGHVVDLRRPFEIPEGSKYKSIYDPSWNAHYQEAGGHMGVNCHHMHIPFDPDVNENNQVQYNPAKAVKQFKKEQGQRTLENRIRKTKTKRMIANELGNESEVKRLSSVLAKQQKTMVQYTRANELRRLPKREQVRIPLKTLMGD